MSWEAAAAYCKEVYGVFVDYEEQYFLCPECGESIYQGDWEEYLYDSCPVCEFIFEEGAE